jgi:hypothetical protein
MGSNGTLECKFLSEKKNRTVQFPLALKSTTKKMTRVSETITPQIAPETERISLSAVP